MGNDQDRLDDLTYNVVRLHNKVNNQQEACMDDIESCFKLTKNVLAHYYDNGVFGYRDISSKVNSKISFNDFIKSFIINKDNINSIKIPLWSVSTEIVLRDLNRLVNHTIESTDERIEFTPYLHMSKKYTRVENQNNECFNFTYARRYGIDSLAVTYNKILKKIGIKKYTELLLILTSLGYEDTPSNILTKFTSDVKN